MSKTSFQKKKTHRMFSKAGNGIYIPIATKLILSYLPIIIVTSGVFTIVGILLISDRILSEAQEKITHDLNSAAEQYQSQLDHISDVVRLTSQRFFLTDALLNNNTASTFAELIKVKEDEGLDILSLSDKNGVVVFRASDPLAPTYPREYDQIVSSVMSQKRPVVSTISISSDELAKESTDLADQALIQIVDTPYARPFSDEYQSSGLMIKAASPVFDSENSFIGVLYGGILLNKNYTLVDDIKRTVFEGVQYKGKDIGTATIFQDDVRISTNVMNTNGDRAIGTRVSEEVYNQVVGEGKPWIGRAFVVNDWYISAYEPIRDIHYKIIGILYVGILEQKYADLKNQTIFVFGSIAIVSIVLFTVISYILSNKISTPINQLLSASREISGGNLNPEISVTSNDELGELSSAFTIMSKALAEREESLKEFTKSKIMESERLAVIGQLAANVAHELNNPLVGIITYSNLLMEDDFCQNSILSEFLNKIVIQANRCKEIVRGLLDYSREPKPDKTLVNLNSLLKRCLSLLENQAIFHNIKQNLSFGDLPMSVVDPSRIERVFMNIIINAAEAMEGVGELSISSKFEREENMVEIVVSDNGPGISAENLENIFDPFFTTKDVGHGVGLGLAISYGIVREHNGTTTVTSKVGKGSTFTVRLPVSIYG